MIVSPTQETLAEASRILRTGGLIGLPTETVYGLAADATQDLAVATIFKQKNRPSFNPLIVHGASRAVFREHVIWNDAAEALAHAFWPGPLTLVLPRLSVSSLSFLVSAGLDSLAIRIPDHPIALALLEVYGRPLAAPSANPSGRLSPTQAIHVETDFPELFILDGGDTVIGLESTIVDLTGETPLLLRPGGLSQEHIENVIGPLGTFQGTALKAPGMMTSHYAPTLPLRLNVPEPFYNEAYLAFGPYPHEKHGVLNLSPRASLTEAAANLFKMLRLLDHPDFCGIAVSPIPSKGLGVGLNDRLMRAAAPRAL